VSKGFTEQYLYRDCDDSFAAGESIALNGENVMGVEYRTSIMFEKANDFITRSAAAQTQTQIEEGESIKPPAPFFLYFAPMSPHSPYVYPPSYQRTFASFNSTLYSKHRRKILTMTTEMDDGLGRIMGTLDRLNLTNNTLIFFVNDNGAPDTSNKLDKYQSNFPFSGYKGDLLEGGIHVRFYARWDGRVRGGIKLTDRISTLDILPTISDLISRGNIGGNIAHSRLSQRNNLDGVSFLDLLIEESSMEAREKQVYLNTRKNRELYWRFSMNCRPAKSALIEGDLKWIEQESRSDQLYNLSSDVSESINLADEFPHELALMKNKFYEWVQDMPPIPKRLTQEECSREKGIRSKKHRPV
jgi:arylsulfatase A-like enzyme